MRDTPVPTVRDTIYYDGACGMCRRSVRWIKRMDWLSRLDAKDMTSIPAEELPVPADAAMAGMPMRTKDGRALVGFPAVRRAALQTPPGALVAWALYIPGVSHLGRAVYNRIARNRARDVGACAIGTHEGRG